MHLVRATAALALVICLAGVAYVAQRIEGTGGKMTGAAETFLGGLTPEQKTKASFAFEDKERTNWHFIPLQDSTRKSTRKGLPLEEMTEAQKKAAMALVATGTSPEGNMKATTIMSLEAILRDLEKGGAMVRNPEWYFFSVFGTPTATGKWGWRVEGHHLSLNFVIDRGKVVAATPAFFGANPATVKSGPRQGLRTLPEAEDLARDLFTSLDADQKKAAYVDKPFPEIEQAKAAHTLGEPKGLAAAQMTESQRGVLMKLLHSYTRRLPADVGEAEMTELKEAGVEKIHFVYAGGLETGQPHTYRVHGPSFLVEFLNAQADSAGNPANHVHSSWRKGGGDFGLSAP